MASTKTLHTSHTGAQYGSHGGVLFMNTTETKNECTGEWDFHNAALRTTRIGDTDTTYTQYDGDASTGATNPEIKTVLDGQTVYWVRKTSVASYLTSWNNYQVPAKDLCELYGISEGDTRTPFEIEFTSVGGVGQSDRCLVKFNADGSSCYKFWQDGMIECARGIGFGRSVDSNDNPQFQNGLRWDPSSATGQCNMTNQHVP